MTDQEIKSLIITLSTISHPFIVKRAEEFVKTSKYCSLSNTQRQAFYHKFFEFQAEEVEKIHAWIGQQAKREATGKWNDIERKLKENLKEVANILDSEEYDYFKNLENFGLKAGSVSSVKNYLFTNENREIARKQFAFEQQKQFVAAINQLCLALDKLKSAKNIENAKDKIGELLSC